MKVFGTSIPESFTKHTFTGLDHNTNYHAWALVVKDINESDAKARIPAFIKTNQIIPILTSTSGDFPYNGEEIYI